MCYYFQGAFQASAKQDLPDVLINVQNFVN